MENFVIANQRNRTFPQVYLDVDSGKCQISGNSYMENAPAFYRPIMDWITQYIEQYQGVLSWEFNLDYYNSCSKKMLIMIVKKLCNYKSSGGRAEVRWYYYPEDQTMLEDVEDLKMFTKITIHTIAHQATRQMLKVLPPNLPDINC
ncbi:MAG TPA: nuclear pore complex subunit [Microscillaceae bacterium]|nr:nuclear pore complex subunit [Microscillaceae bacterium]